MTHTTAYTSCSPTHAPSALHAMHALKQMCTAANCICAQGTQQQVAGRQAQQFGSGLVLHGRQGGPQPSNYCRRSEGADVNQQGTMSRRFLISTISITDK